MWFCCFGVNLNDWIDFSDRLHPVELDGADVILD